MHLFNKGLRLRKFFNVFCWLTKLSLLILAVSNHLFFLINFLLFKRHPFISNTFYTSAASLWHKVPTVRSIFNFHVKSMMRDRTCECPEIIMKYLYYIKKSRKIPTLYSSFCSFTKWSCSTRKIFFVNLNFVILFFSYIFEFLNKLLK